MELINQLPAFLLVLVRLSTFFIVAPIFSHRTLPPQVKIGLAVFISMIAFTTITTDKVIALDALFFFLILKEAIVGIAIGFVAAMVLYIVQIAGTFIDFQMGFAIANVLDPQSGTQVSIIGSFKYMFATLFLLSVNGHHMMIDGMIMSYQLVPIDSGLILGNEKLIEFITGVFVKMFASAFQLALPVVGSLFLVDIALGLLARTVPQMNVFVIGMPLKVIVGLAIIIITLPGFFYVLSGVMRNMVNTMGQLMTLIGG